VIRTKLARFVFAAAFMAVALPAAAGAADLRVCADPDYMPFSDKAGEGFENKVAAYTAHALGEKLVYVWASTRGNGGFDQFVHENLDKKKCDVVMDVPYAADNILATEPYYISSYVFIYPKKKHYDISSMDSPALKGLRIGFEADTPAENGLKLRTLIIHATPFDSTDAPNSDTDEMLQALAAGKIAVGVTWEPAVGYYLHVAAVCGRRGAEFAFAGLARAVRLSDVDGGPTRGFRNARQAQSGHRRAQGAADRDPRA
jgi:mxaJ protein